MVTSLISCGSRVSPMAASLHRHVRTAHDPGMSCNGLSWGMCTALCAGMRSSPGKVPGSLQKDGASTKLLRADV